MQNDRGSHQSAPGFGLVTTNDEIERSQEQGDDCRSCLIRVNFAALILQLTAFSLGFENPLLEPSRPRRFAATFFFPSGDLRPPRPTLAIFHFIEQTFARQLA